MIKIGYGDLSRHGCFVGASLESEKPLIFRSNGSIKIEKIGDAVDRYFEAGAEDKVDTSDMEVVAFDSATLEVRWRRVQYVHSHRRPGKLLRFKLQTGRRCTVTPDHSLFVPRQGEIWAEPASDIKHGDFAVGLKAIPAGPTYSAKDAVTTACLWGDGDVPPVCAHPPQTGLRGGRLLPRPGGQGKQEKHRKQVRSAAARGGARLQDRRGG